jgi:transposase
MGRAARQCTIDAAQDLNGVRAMSRVNDLSYSRSAFDQDSTLIAVIELSLKNWLVAGLVPGLARQPLKKLAADRDGLLRLLERWRKEAEKAGKVIKRVAVAYEAGRDGFWLARWLRRQGIEAYVIHAASIAMPRVHRRAKSDRLDTESLTRGFLGWLRGEKRHCQMCHVPSLEEEDARRPGRERDKLTREQTRLVNRIKAMLNWLGISGFNAKRPGAEDRLAELRTPEGLPVPAKTAAELRRYVERLQLVRQQIKEIERERAARLAAEPSKPNQAMKLLQQIMGIGPETADTLTNEVLMRPLRDRRAVARYGGLTGAPDESGSKRREKGLARAGNLRVRHTMVQLAWRWLMFQKDSALARWFFQRTENASPLVRKKMIVALARKLLLALWRYVTTGEIPQGVAFRQPAV